MRHNLPIFIHVVQKFSYFKKGADKIITLSRIRVYSVLLHILSFNENSFNIEAYDSETAR